MSETEPRAPLPPEIADLFEGTRFTHSDCLSHYVFGPPCWPTREAHSSFSVGPPHNGAFTVSCLGPRDTSARCSELSTTISSTLWRYAGSRVVPKTESLSVQCLWKFSFIPGHQGMSGTSFICTQTFLHFSKTPPDSLSATYLFYMPNPSENICQSTQILGKWTFKWRFSFKNNVTKESFYNKTQSCDIWSLQIWQVYKSKGATLHTFSFVFLSLNMTQEQICE